MAGFDPDAYLKADTPGFNPDEYLKSSSESSSDSNPMSISAQGIGNAILSELGGASKTATGGWAPQINAAIGTGIDAALKASGNLFLDKDEENPYKDQSTGDMYNAELAKSKGSYQAGHEQNPVGDIAGQMLGAGVFPASTESFIAQGMSQGLADSNKPDIMGKVQDAMSGGAAGLTGALAGQGIGAGVKAVANSAPAQWMATKAASVLGDVPEVLSKKLIENPNMPAAKDLDTIAENVANHATGLKKEISTADAEAWKTLNQHPTMSTDQDLKPIVTDAMRNSGVLRFDSNGNILPANLGQDRYALKKGQEVLKELDTYENKSMSEAELKSLVQKIDKEIDWGKETHDTANNMLMGIRVGLDNVLKNNPEYKAAMEPVAQKIQDLDSLRKTLRLAKDGDEFVSTDTTLNNLKRLANDTSKVESMKPNAQKAVETASPGTMEDLDNYRVNELSKQDITRGSKRATGFALMGGTLGHAIGGPEASAALTAAGYATGATLDRYGRPLVTGALKKASPLIKGFDSGIAKTTGFTEDMWNKVPSKYQQIMKNAAQQGGRSLAITHFLLSNEDPEYQDAMNPSK